MFRIYQFVIIFYFCLNLLLPLANINQCPRGIEETWTTGKWQFTLWYRTVREVKGPTKWENQNETRDLRDENNFPFPKYNTLVKPENYYENRHNRVPK